MPQDLLATRVTQPVSGLDERKKERFCTGGMDSVLGWFVMGRLGRMHVDLPCTKCLGGYALADLLPAGAVSQSPSTRDVGLKRPG
jgi:hypothetical protein